jgi:hypothetical protein
MSGFIPIARPITAQTANETEIEFSIPLPSVDLLA